MPYTYDRSKEIIQQCQKKYQQQYQEINKEINEYIKETPDLINLDKITCIISELVHKSQYQLHMEFERRRGTFDMRIST